MYRNITLEITDKIHDFKKVKWKTKGFQTTRQKKKIQKKKYKYKFQ